jgi:hypothetical protein
MADTGNTNGRPPRADHNLVATYADAEHARSAIEALERKGVEAGNITLFGDGVEPAETPETNVEQRKTDMATTGKVGKRALSGLVVGAVLGALIGAVGGYLLYTAADIGPNEVVTAVGGAIALGGFGAYAGGWYGGASALPVSTEAWTKTFESTKPGEACVAVHSADRSQVDTAAEALAGTSAMKIVRFGRDGKQEQVA